VRKALFDKILPVEERQVKSIHHLIALQISH
jgi:hypothetical protein